MTGLTVLQAAKACNGTILKGDENAPVQGASIDSRKIEEGNIFVAIKGENTDGHKYLSQAGEKGAAAVLISDEAYAKDVTGDTAVILCEDTTKGLQEIARAYRNSMDIKIIGVTGSVGKTSTSDMVKAVCQVKYKTAKTKGNFNNHLGMPLTLLSFEPDTEVGILEMGMDRPGEIRFLAEIARPNLGVITNIGTMHIEHLGSRENIFKAKMEITEFFGEGNILVVNGNDDFLQDISSDVYKIDKSGENEKCSFRITEMENRGEDGVAFTFSAEGKSMKIEIPAFGLHNALNASLAVTAGLELGITMEEAAKGLSSLEMTGRRLTIREADGIKIIDDTYNAGPASTKAAIDVLMSLEGERRIAILGDMFELGHTSADAHREVGAHAAKKGVDLLIAIGTESEQTMEGGLSALPEEKVKYFASKELFFEAMDDIIFSQGDVILVKGSNGMHMDQIVNKIIER